MKLPLKDIGRDTPEVQHIFQFAIALYTIGTSELGNNAQLNMNFGQPKICIEQHDSFT